MNTKENESRDNDQNKFYEIHRKDEIEVKKIIDQIFHRWKRIGYTLTYKYNKTWN